MACPDCIAHQIGSTELIRTLLLREGALPPAGSIELTLRCNLRCRHCYILYPGATDGEMNTAEACAVLDKLADGGVLFLLMTGGEIFARHDFRDIYLHAKRRGFLLTLFTNATLIDENLADFLAEWPPRRIEVTIYGHTPETYERVTGVRGSFARFRRGVELLLSRRLPLALKTIVLRSNRHEFGQIKAWAEGLGVPFRFDTIVNPRLNGDRAVLIERITPEEVVELEGASDAHRRQYESLVERARALPPRDRLFTCGAGIRTVHVDARGLLHPCMLWRSTPLDLKVGAVDDWRSLLDELRSRAFPRDSPCRACAHRLACNNCAATSALENAGRAGQPVSYYCGIRDARYARFDLQLAATGEYSTTRSATGMLTSNGRERGE